jgi:hypothetical protein
MDKKPIEKPRRRTLPKDERQIVERKLRAAGLLVTDLEIPADLEPVSDEEIAVLGVLPPGARSSEEILDEERGPY